MNKKKRMLLGILGCMALGMTPQAVFATEETVQTENIKTEAVQQEATSGNVAGVSIFVQGYEWGPGVPKVIVELKEPASQITWTDCKVSTAGMERKVTDMYLCDEEGNKSEEASNYVAVEMEMTAKESGNPFYFDMSVRMNKWLENYPVIVNCTGFTADGIPSPFTVNEDCIENRICPDTERFNHRGVFTDTYRNEFTGKDEKITLRTAAYEPEALEGGEKNPLIIWLHGGGEGGTDPDIAILGNEVVALAREGIQSYFSAGAETGAYVLAVQTETYWLDEGDGKIGRGNGVSRYTEALMDAIQEYVDSNSDIDKNRIYLGGCSNGGYMTMHMLVTYPDYFAAAYPCCEAYPLHEYSEEQGHFIHELWLTDEKVEAIKDIPIWFIVSADDKVLSPRTYTLPVYRALVQAGAENTWLSLYESVVGTDSPGTKYMGHFSWIYIFNDQVTGVQDKAAVAASTDMNEYGTTPTNQGGGTARAGEYENLFAWLNAQSK